jgi:tetratricopeptide (TPR) repeat protein
MSLVAALLLLAALTMPAKPNMAAPGTGAFDTEEVLLTFRYRGVGNVYVTGLYDYSVDKMFLPVSELFSHLYIYYEASPGDFTLSGTFITPDQPYRFFFNQQQVVLAGQTYTFEADDFRIGDMDFFASPKVYEEVFGLFFTINLNLLTLSLEADFTLPVEERAERERRRQLIEAREVTREFFPLALDRDRSMFDFGFADYNITASFSQNNPNMNYNVTGGIELMGGDLQGNVIGSWSDAGHNIRTSGLRWRYVVRNNIWFSSLTAGQLSTSGLQPRNLRGISVSNDPVEPRRLFETYILDGYTDPDSEVELYMNNRLVDFSRADAAGYYRFEFPITYGTSRVTINIYTPTGETRSIDRQLQIPFTFLPPGQIAYNIQGGLTETFLGGEEDVEKAIVHGNVAMGLTSWLTAKVGSEYIQDITDDRPFIYGGLSARVLSQYLVNVDFAPEAFYRGITSVMFPSGRSFNVQYTWYDGESLFNSRGAEQDINATVFMPFMLFNTQMGFRVGGEHTLFENSSLTRYRTDLSMRLGRFNVRMNYRDALFYSDNEYTLGQGQASGSLTYTFQRSPGVPVFIRGMFLRGNLSYSVASNELDQADLQLTRSIRQWGRLNLNAGYDFRSEQTTVRLGFTMDLAPVRSTTNVDVSGDRSTVRQNLRGSLGFDRNPDRIVTTNRNQVGRAGASVILFVDNNNSGTYDEGDEIIPYRAVRLDRSAQMQVGRDGVLRISQLQSYFQYNLQVIRQALPNPLLAPGKDEFSFVADPNQYKRIEIPFYRTGVIDGTVYIIRDGVQQTQGGLRLIINGLDNDFRETVRNFSDGSYYAMDMPPGRYTIAVDQQQLDFLDVEMRGGPREFVIRALSEGDFIENLDIILEKEVVEPSMLAFARDHIRLYVSAQNAFYEQDYAQALTFVDEALDIFRTNFAIAFKGTVLYMLGNKEEAMEMWREANRRNPSIGIPDVNVLDRLISGGL